MASPDRAQPEAATPPAPPALVGARTLIAALVAHGMRHVVLAPGSRSAPLAYALAEAADDGALRLHVRVDERSAGFLALGLARGQMPGENAPVGIVTTSGTAVANLHPAVLEAHHGQVPLIVLTADRPHELRGTGANQTTDQVEIFGSATRFAADVPAPAGLAHEAGHLRALAARAVAAATGTRTGDPGPVQLNISFRDPLSPLIAPVAPAAAAPIAPIAPIAPDAPAAPAPTPVAECAKKVGFGLENPALFAHSARGTGLRVEELPQGRAVVVAGDGAGPVARALAEARGWPLLAESVSGAAGGPNLVWAHAQVLTHAAIAREVEHAVVVGRPTLSRPVQQLLARPEVEVTVIAPGAAQWPDAARNAAVVLAAIPQNWLDEPEQSEPSGSTEQTAPSTERGRSEPSGSTEPNWLARWREAGHRAHDVVLRELEGDALTGPRLAHQIASVLTAADTLVIGSSNPVRDLDLVAAWPEPPRIIANRGLAGIDGMISTATGVALAQSAGDAAHLVEQRPAARRTVRAYLGDLTFLHDVGGLLGAPGEPEPDLQIIVANDQGGSIFASLEHGALAASNPQRGATFERIFATPHTVDIAALCAGYGIQFTRAADAASLVVALAEPQVGVSVVEVVLTRSQRRDAAARLNEQLAESLE